MNILLLCLQEFYTFVFLSLLDKNLDYLKY